MASISKTALYIVAAILILFSLIGIIWGFISIVGSTDKNGDPSWFGTGVFFCMTGLAIFGIGLGLILWAARRKQLPGSEENKVTLKIDLPGNVKLDTLKCQSCGGALNPENITMVAGAPVVTCPFCNTTYQLTEEPKW
jgi:hypothetical protein